MTIGALYFERMAILVVPNGRLWQALEYIAAIRERNASQEIRRPWRVRDVKFFFTAKATGMLVWL